MNNTSINEEALNPAPHKYQVSQFTKIIFLAFFIIGLGSYFYLIIDRRISQRRFMFENQMGATRIAPMLTPSINITDAISGLDSNLRDHRGSWVLLNIWATWCSTCQEEMPSIELLHQELGEKIKIIALSIDDNREELDKYIKNHDLNFKIFHDKEQQIPRLFGINKYPETFLISPDGMLTFQFSGPRNWASATMTKYLSSIINS
jgi:thiol-disulfide isomerase/thioredoxin